MYNCVIANLEAETSNITLEDFRVASWRFTWANNRITAITVTKTTGVLDVFDTLRKPEKLGLLVDVLSLVTDFTVSADVHYLLYKIDRGTKLFIEDRSKSFSEVMSKIRSFPCIQQGDNMGDEWPVRVRKNTTHTIPEEQIALMKYLLSSIESHKITKTELKLMNYWRRGFDLENLTYDDESFLAFYKILEYFEKRTTSLTEKQKVLIKNQKSKTVRKAMRMALASGVRNPLAKKKIELLTDFIHIRNNFDIAHMRIKPLPRQRESALYFTYTLGVWENVDHIQEISRLFLLYLLGVKKIELKVEGGLLRLHR